MRPTACSVTLSHMALALLSFKLHAGVSVASDGVQPLTVPGMLQADIAQWQRVVPPNALTIGFGALYAAWGSADCAGLGAAGGVNQTCSLALSLAACKAAGVHSGQSHSIDTVARAVALLLVRST